MSLAFASHDHVTMHHVRPSAMPNRLNLIRLEIGINQAQQKPWEDFARALERTANCDDDFDSTAAARSMDRPADVTELVDCHLATMTEKVSHLQQLRQKAADLCELLNARQRQKINRLILSALVR